MNQPRQTRHIGHHVRNYVLPKNMSVTKAAKILGIGRPALSNLLNGNSTLSTQMAMRLERGFGANADDLIQRQGALEALGRKDEEAPSLIVSRFAPRFLEIKANDIESWANRKIGSRNRMAVLLRRLVHETCDGLKRVDFPGNDDAERPGWDGRVETTQGNSWVPVGLSGWEFGTSNNPSAKANNDYKKRTEATSKSARKETFFVFVTPHRWKNKRQWEVERQSRGDWKGVRALDSSDLEQWLEQSIASQAWMGCEIGRDSGGLRPLQECWKEWSSVCEPALSEEMFCEAIAIHGEKLRKRLLSQTPSLIRVSGDSRQEALAFLWAFLDSKNELSVLRDKAVVFTKPGKLSNLVKGATNFLPIIVREDVEREFAESGSKMVGIVVEPRSCVNHQGEFVLQLLSSSGFREYSASLGFSEDRTRQLEVESGKSLTVLRRRLATSPTVQHPKWASDDHLATALLPMALAGAWQLSNENDRKSVVEMSESNSLGLFERGFVNLQNVEDSPVWSAGGFQGVVSKLDALFAVSSRMTSAQIKKFFEVAEEVLSETDPSLELAEDRQWMSGVLGKERRFSDVLRRGISESLVLFAIHGNVLFGNRLGCNLVLEVSKFVHRLINPLTPTTLMSNSFILPLLAEAAPESLISTLEEDSAKDEPAVSQLMKPARDVLFGRSDRAQLLWALELLAWDSEWFERVVTLLGEYSQMEPNDNLMNKPSHSLRSIFRYWMPQTSVSLQHRKEALGHLAEDLPTVAWQITASQFNPQDIGQDSRKPIWRDYAVGCGGVVRDESASDFVSYCKETCLNWPVHSLDTLRDLISGIDEFRSHIDQVGLVISDWARRASPKEIEELREHVRVSIPTAPQIQPDDGDSKKLIQLAKDLLKTLDSGDLVWKHAWLFRTQWVCDSRDEIEDDLDFEQSMERISALRKSAVKEVLSAHGFNGMLQLAFCGTAPQVAGSSVAEVIASDEERIAFLKTVLGDCDAPKSVKHQSLIEGFLSAIGSACSMRLVVSLWPIYGDEVGILLLCLAEFERPIWVKVEQLNSRLQDQYWIRVTPRLSNVTTEEDANYAVKRLLKVHRSATAVCYGRFNWERIESGLIKNVLSELLSCEEFRHEDVKFDRFSVERAFEVLNDRKSLSREEMARLEFLFLDMFWLDEGGIPNLEQEIEAKPEIFSEVIEMAYKPENSTEARELTEQERALGLKAHKLLMRVSRLPGHEENGALSADRLEVWVRRVRELCAANGRPTLGDRHIGQLLSNSPSDDSGEWPCDPVRAVLERVLNKPLSDGFIVGRRNRRGIHSRGEGGEQEREIAEQYETWADSCESAYPRVSNVLRTLAFTYQDEGRWEDQRQQLRERLEI